MQNDFIAALSHNSTLTISAKIVALLKEFPFRTVNELARKVPATVISAEQLHKRLPDLRKKGLVFNPMERFCTVTGKFVYTWAARNVIE